MENNKVVMKRRVSSQCKILPRMDHLGTMWVDSYGMLKLLSMAYVNLGIVLVERGDVKNGQEAIMLGKDIAVGIHNRHMVERFEKDIAAIQKQDPAVA
jgi:hypothetical protein